MINALGAAQPVSTNQPSNNKIDNLEKDIAGAETAQPVLTKQNIPTVEAVAPTTPNSTSPETMAEDKKPGTVTINPDLKNFKSGKKKINPKLIIGTLVLVLLLVGGGVGLYLTRISQEIRQQAAVGDYCNDEPDCKDGASDTAKYTCDTNDPNHPIYYKGVCKLDTLNCSSVTNCGTCNNGATKVGCVYYPSTGGCGPECHIKCADGSWSLTVGNGPTCDNANCDGATHVTPCDNWEKCLVVSTPTPTTPSGGGGPGTSNTPTPTMPTITLTATPTGTLSPTPTGKLSPTPTGTLSPTPTGTLSPTPTMPTITLTATPTGTLSPTPTDVIISSTPTSTPVVGATNTPVPTKVVYNYTPAPTSPGCNSYCTENSTCTSINANWICYENKCRLDVNPTSPYCDYPQVLPKTGPTEWLNFLKVGLGMLGTAALLLLVL